MILLNFQNLLGCLYAAVTSSQRQSSSAVRRIHPRRMSSLVLRRHADVAFPVSPPLLRRAIPSSSPPILQRVVPASLPLHPVTTTLTSITVSLPRSFASGLVAASNVTDAAVTRSPRTTQAGEGEPAVTGDRGLTSPSTGLHSCCYSMNKFHRNIYAIFKPHCMHSMSIPPIATGVVWSLCGSVSQCVGYDCELCKNS